MACECQKNKNSSTPTGATPTPVGDAPKALAHPTAARPTGALERAQVASARAATLLPSVDEFTSILVLAASGCDDPCDSDVARAAIAYSMYAPLIRAMQRDWGESNVHAFARALVCLGCDLCPPQQQQPTQVNTPALPPPTEVIEPPEEKALCDEPRPTASAQSPSNVVSIAKRVNAAQARAHAPSAGEQRRRTAQSIALTRAAIGGIPLDRVRHVATELHMSQESGQALYMSTTAVDGAGGGGRY